MPKIKIEYGDFVSANFSSETSFTMGIYSDILYPDYLSYIISQIDGMIDVFTEDPYEMVCVYRKPHIGEMFDKNTIIDKIIYNIEQYMGFTEEFENSRIMAPGVRFNIDKLEMKREARIKQEEQKAKQEDQAARSAMENELLAAEIERVKIDTERLKNYT